jgi:uncharacterized membrane protein YbhN (UPF0104 family)
LGDSTSGKTRSTVFLVLTNLVSVGCLIWTLHDAKLGELKDDLASMNWWWVGLAVIADVAVYCWHAWRWSLLLHPVEPVTFWQTVRAIYIGLFANEVLPFRAGELLRCYLLSRWTELPFSVSLSSVIIERIFDGLWLCACLLVTVRIVLFPMHLRYLVDGGYVLGVIVLAGAGAAGGGHVPSAEGACRAQPALATALARTHRRPEPDRALPLPVFRVPAEPAVSAVTSDPDLWSF